MSSKMEDVPEIFKPIESCAPEKIDSKDDTGINNMTTGTMESLEEHETTNIKESKEKAPNNDEANEKRSHIDESIEKAANETIGPLSHINESIEKAANNNEANEKISLIDESIEKAANNYEANEKISHFDESIEKAANNNEANEKISHINESIEKAANNNEANEKKSHIDESIEKAAKNNEANEKISLINESIEKAANSNEANEKISHIDESIEKAGNEKICHINKSIERAANNNEANEKMSHIDCAKSIDCSKIEKSSQENIATVPEVSDQFSSDHNYELIDNVYYYSDNEKRYMYDSSQEKWVEVNSASSDDGSVTTDSEGRQYYYAEGVYLCRDTTDNVFYMDENNEWKPWNSERENVTTKSRSDDNRCFYFYQGDQRFYRDNSSNKVYRQNSDTNEWEEYKGKKRKKKVYKSDEEEFDTSEEGSEEEDTSDGQIPPGWLKDPSISHDGKVYVKLDPSDNAKYEWEPSRRAWFPMIDDDFMATYQLGYGFNPDGSKNLNPVKYDDIDDEIEQDRLDEEKKKEEEEEKKKLAEKKRKPGWFECSDEHNPRVYVSNLPTTMSEDDYVEFMTKCGLIFKDPETQKFKIKMYKDEEGNFKGDALCTYIKIESVELALQILDGAKLGSKTITVERAKFELKGQYDATKKPKKRRKKVLEKIQKAQDKLLAWHPDPLRGQRAKHETTVILRNVFDPNEFNDAPEKILTHKEGIRLQAETFGKVKKIELFDRHVEGVVKVIFIEVECADMCAATLNNRLYLKRKLKVETWDGREQFMIEESEEERAERIKKWDKFLEEGKGT